MRVLIALGGNAMTGARRQRPPRGPARRRPGRDAPPSPTWSRAGHRGRAHPRQRPAGRQPAGQERARRARRPAGAAGLVRRADPGHARLPAAERARATRWPRAACRAPVAALVTRTLVDADDPGFDRPDQADRPVPPARPRPQRSIAHGETWEDRGDAGWRRVVASPEPLEILDAPAVHALVDAGFVVVAHGGGGIPVRRATPTAALRGVEAVIDKDLGRRAARPRPSTPTSS